MNTENNEDRERIKNAMDAPKQFSNAEGSVSERSGYELIEMDKYKKSLDAGTVSPFGIRFARTVPNGKDC